MFPNSTEIDQPQSSHKSNPKKTPRLPSHKNPRKQSHNSASKLDKTPQIPPPREHRIILQQFLRRSERVHKFISLRIRVPERSAKGAVYFQGA